MGGRSEVVETGGDKVARLGFNLITRVSIHQGRRDKKTK
jgi:hypothetical protein